MFLGRYFCKLFMHVLSVYITQIFCHIKNKQIASRNPQFLLYSHFTLSFMIAVNRVKATMFELLILFFNLILSLVPQLNTCNADTSDIQLVERQLDHYLSKTNSNYSCYRLENRSNFLAAAPFTHIASQSDCTGFVITTSN